MALALIRPPWVLALAGWRLRLSGLHWVLAVCRMALTLIRPTLGVGCVPDGAGAYPAYMGVGCVLDGAGAYPACIACVL